ncbi:heterokaryon incompatibility protein-domain-containing protein [Nemania abortiva]|nr:heterokaryon incompatibility protein-domain-containing protein [Nemania abortiva]
MATTRDIVEDELAIAHNGLLEAKQSHETHGHPPLTDPGKEFWMKWDEWNPGLMEKSQYNQIEQFEESLKPGLEWLHEFSSKLDFDLPPISFPEPPPEDASYNERQGYLVESFEAALDIALPKQSDPAPVKQRLLQKSLDQYRVLYQRLPLGNDPTMIRLLEIPPSPSIGSRIEARLFNASLESPGLSYEALSYVWGTVLDPQHLQSIYINGLVQRVTPNLHSALSSLRLADRSRVLWVDSICINQGDLNERARQIILMAQIFAKAERTVVYLGPSTATSTALFRFLGLPLCQPLACDTCGLDRTLLEELRGPREACTKAGLEESEVLDGFIDICRREWWDRVWILQEFTLSKQDPTIYCGRDAVPNRLLAKNFYKIYQWVSHTKMHYTPVTGCSRCARNKDDFDRHTHDPNGDPDRKGEETAIIEDLSDNEDYQRAARTESIQTAEAIAEEQEAPNDAEPSLPKPMEIPLQGRSGHQWSLWGVSAWKASAVLQRRSTCRPWHATDHVYRLLKARCSDPHDIVYGVRELLEPTFRQIFKPNYAIPIPKLYTKLSAYILLFHSWPDMFYYYPHRLLLNPSGLQPAIDTPSWVPDFTMPAVMKEAEKRPPYKEIYAMDNSHGPYILDRVLFMSGVLLDEIEGVFPLPKNDPFKLLQQLWYLERLYGSPGYELFHKGRLDGPESHDNSNSLIQKVQGFVAYPSISWATRYAGGPSGDMSIVHIISKTADFNNLPIALKKCYGMVSIYIKQQFEHEGKKTGPRASQEEHEEYWKRNEDILERLHELLMFLIDDKWLDFIGICTFDFESLRGQIRHHLMTLIAWKPSRLPGHDTPYEEGVNKCDPPFTSAVFQRPVRYGSILRAIARGVESDGELEMRREAAMLIAKTVHDATAPVVGGQNEVRYAKLDSRGRERSVGEKNSDDPRRFDISTEEVSHEARNDVDETTQLIIDDIAMLPLPEDVARAGYEDTPLVAFLAPPEAASSVNRIDSYLEKTTKTSDIETTVEGEEEEGDCMASHSSEATSDTEEIDNDSIADDPITLSHRRKSDEPALGFMNDARIEDDAILHERASKTQQSSTDSTHTRQGSSHHVSPVQPQTPPRSEKTTGYESSWWRRTERRRPANVHFLLEEVVDFLSGRSFFITETRLLGLTGPGEYDVCDGDDLLLLRGMSFPVIARLEPLKKLGNPKRRRRDLETNTGMRRKILGTAIVRGVEPNGGNFDEVKFPEDFEPLSGFDPEFFTFN